MKKERRAKIIELIENNQIETQDELAEMLEKSGFAVTQSTICRDIRELRLTKVSIDNEHKKYVNFHEKEADMSYKYIRVLKDGYLSMDPAENIIVIKTLSGMAMAVAAAIDNLEIPGIVGCIAGDDTIMCAIRTVGEVERVIKSIENLLEE